MLGSLSFGDYFGLVLSSAAIAAVVSGVFSLWIYRANRKDQRSLRAEDAHIVTREHFLPLAKDVVDWIEHDFGVRYGMDVDYHGSNAPAPRFSSVAEVLAALSEIEYTHPDDRIREKANHLDGLLNESFNMIQPGVGQEDPSFDEERKWRDEARLLVEWIRDGPPPAIADQ